MADVAQMTCGAGLLVDVGLVVHQRMRSVRIAEAVARVNAVGLDVVSVDAGGRVRTPAQARELWTCDLGPSRPERRDTSTRVVRAT
jgi:hypothetical protein